jgi:glycerol 2-dehydrogenase (NADP+)
MQKLLEGGRVKTIGVSNFQIRHLEKLLSDPSCKTVPAVNQLEVCYQLNSATMIRSRLTQCV